MAHQPCGLSNLKHHFLQMETDHKRDICVNCGVMRLVPRRPEVIDESFVCLRAFKEHAWMDSSLQKGKSSCARCGIIQPHDDLCAIDHRTTAQKIEEKLNVAKAIANAAKNESFL